MSHNIRNPQDSSTGRFKDYIFQAMGQYFNKAPKFVANEVVFEAAFELGEEHQRNRVCRWVFPENGYYIAPCKDVTVYKSGDYCPYCGGKIEVAK